MNDTVYGVSPGLVLHEMYIVGCDKVNCGKAAREGALGYDSAHRCKRSARYLTVGEHSVLPRNVKSYVFPIMNPEPHRKTQPHHRNRQRQEHRGSC